MSILFFAHWLGCQDAAPPSSLSAELPVDVLESISEEGPVKATVRIWPKTVRLGDPLRLQLEVESEQGVEVELPPFGEALGRFQVGNFSPRATSGDDGSRIEVQTYSLQAPMSGSQHLPSLRVVYWDRRDGSDGEEKELLTDELSVEVEGLLDADAPLEFRAQKPVLAKRIDLPPWMLGAGSLLCLLIATAAGLRIYRGWTRMERMRTSYEEALEQLAALERKGLQDGSADVYFANLSMIVRRYVEARYGLQAPEQTTEEFLQAAMDGEQIGDSHQVFLGSFLARCDEVKFAKAQPVGEEGSQIVSQVRRFLEESRPTEEAA
jgi:hypothetical protein